MPAPDSAGQGASGATQPLVSIVTPSLNHARFIRDTIESIAAQSYPAIEHIVIDGGSTDGTREILEEYGDRLTWVSEPDDGQSAAINKGFAMARGEILSWLNTDDTLLPDAVAVAVAELERDPELGMVYGDGYVAYESGAISGEVRMIEPNLWLLQNVLDYVFQPATFLRREALEDVGYLDESLNWVMDWDLFLKITRRHRTRHVRELIATQRFYRECKTASGGFRRYREIVEVLKRNGGRRYSWARASHAFEVVATTFERGWESTFDRGPSNVGTPQSRAARAFARFQALALQRTVGSWADGWMGSRARIPLLVESPAVRLEGEVPPFRSLQRGQRVRVACNGDQLADVLLPPGRFSLELPLKTPSSGETELVLKAERTVARSELPKVERRRLAYRLTAIEPSAASEARLQVVPDHTGSGWYPDAWMEPQTSIWVLPPGGRIVLSGVVPPDRPKLHGQKLTLSWNGRPVHETTIEVGEFTCEFAVPRTEDDYGLLEIACSRSIVPREEGVNDDARRLAVMILSLAGIEPPSAQTSMA